MTNCCPSCGYNFTADKVIERDGFVLDPSGLVTYLGRDIGMSPGNGRLLHTIASGNGRPIRAEAIVNRITDSERPNTCHVLIYQARKKLLASGIPWPVRNKHNVGYYWAPAHTN